MSLFLYFIRIPLAAQKPCSFFIPASCTLINIQAQPSVSSLLLQDTAFHVSCDLSSYMILTIFQHAYVCIILLNMGILIWAHSHECWGKPRFMGSLTKHAGSFTAHYSLRSVPFKQASCLCYYFIVWWSCPEHVLALDMLTWVTYPSGSLASRTQTRNTEAFFYFYLVALKLP